MSVTDIIFFVCDDYPTAIEYKKLLRILFCFFFFIKTLVRLNQIVS